MPVPKVIKAIQTSAPALIPNETKAKSYYYCSTKDYISISKDS